MSEVGGAEKDDGSPSSCGASEANPQRRTVETRHNAAVPGHRQSGRCREIRFAISRCAMLATGDAAATVTSERFSSSFIRQR
jgi:hypothetical protein